MASNKQTSEQIKKKIVRLFYKIERDENCILCRIDNLSDELKQLIRDQLSAICHGKVKVEENLKIHSYKETLKSFLDRYKNKSIDTKKGMIGEFLSHLIIDKVLPQLESISVLFNKEELSIKKGFDLNYVEKNKNVIWYGEVKSGQLQDGDMPDDGNKKLLRKSKKGLGKLLSSQRGNLWDSVITDTYLTITGDKSITVRKLLNSDFEEIEDGNLSKKNGILISVFFHNTNEEVSHKSICEYLKEVLDEDIFSDVILFSIQKSTYEAIEQFLIEEVADI